MENKQTVSNDNYMLQAFERDGIVLPEGSSVSEPEFDDAWWVNKRWYFDGREVRVAQPDEQYLSVICIPVHPDLADYIVDLHNASLDKDKK